MKPIHLMALWFSLMSAAIAMPISAQETSVSKPSTVRLTDLVPADLTSLIMIDNANMSVKPGSYNKKDVLLSIPFTYLKVVRTTSDIVGKRTFVTQTVIEKGLVGFETYADWERNGRRHKTLCFFQFQHNNYQRPGCYLVIPLKDGGFWFFRAAAPNNVPSRFVENDMTGVDIPAEQAKGIVTADSHMPEHDFKLDLTVKHWKDGAIIYQWRSDGLNVGEPVNLPMDTDGVGRIELDVGMLTVRPEKNGKISVNFTAKAM